ncbi:MAG: hypothetical protein WCF78_02365 [archaeon]
MVSITLAVTKDIREKMKEYNEINWSEYIRKNITKKIDEMELINKIIKNEEKITDWSVALQKKSRAKSNRFEELKKMGLI